MEIKIQEENFLKAYREGCSDVKKVLENLAPELFTSEYPCLKKWKYSNLVVLFTQKKTGYAVTTGGPDKIGDFNEDWVEDDFSPIKGLREIE